MDYKIELFNLQAICRKLINEIEESKYSDEEKQAFILNIKTVLRSYIND